MVSISKKSTTAEPPLSDGSTSDSPNTSGVEKKQNGEEEANPGDFKNFAISDDIISRLQKRGITHLFPVQVSTFRPVYKGKDVITQARTGSGKTLSFSLPIVSRLEKSYTGEQVRGRPTKVIVLAPTRELAVQIYDDFVSVSDTNKLKIEKFYGGSSYNPQETAMRRGIDILVGTPGRIMDLCEKGKLDLTKVSHVILDEADRMLEIGFKEHIDMILSYCYSENKPQMLLFSATMPPWVSQVARKYMDKPKTINLVSMSNKTSATVNHLAIRCMWQNRNDIIGDIVQQYSGRHGRAIVFTQTKVEANDLSVSTCINMEAQVLHGDIVQKQRELRLQGFRDGKFQCLVATDVAARGLDIPEIDLVIQCEPPKDVDSYIHRSGRTGRAGRSGTSVCLYNAKQEWALKEVEKKAGIKFQRVTPPQPHTLIESAVRDATRCIDNVPPKVLPEFRKYAKEMLETRPAEELLAAALSHISGLTEIKNRSLLSSMENFTAYQMSNTYAVRAPYHFWNALENCLGASFRAEVKFMKLTKDKTGCVIDVPCRYEEFIQDQWVDTDEVQLFKMTELPELDDYEPRGQYGNGGGGGRGYGNNRNGGGYNNRSNNSWGNKGQGNGGFKRRNDFGNGGYGAKRTKF